MFSDTPEGVKANVRAIRQILDQAGRRDYTVKVFRMGHNLMEVPPDNSTRDPPQTIPTGFLRNDGRLDDNTHFVGVHQQYVSRNQFLVSSF